MAAILKNVKCDISAAVRPMMMHLSSLNLMGNQKLKISKSKMADGGHLENREIATSSKPFGRFCGNFVR